MSREWGRRRQIRRRITQVMGVSEESFGDESETTSVVLYSKWGKIERKQREK